MKKKQPKAVHPMTAGNAAIHAEEILEILIHGVAGYSYKNKMNLANNIARLSVLLLDEKRGNLEEIRRELKPLVIRYKREFWDTN